MLWFKEIEGSYHAYRLQISKDPAIKGTSDNIQKSRFVMGILMDTFNLYETRDKPANRGK
jgi:hypothetical protein